MPLCACGYSSETAWAQCPRCHTWTAPTGGTVAEIPPETWAPKRLARVPILKVSRVSLKNDALNTFFAGGPVRSCSYLINAEPGFGKTSLCIQMSQYFKTPLFISAEMTPSAVKLFTARFKGDFSDLEIVELHDMALVEKNITTYYDAVFYDSTHAITSHADSRAGAGSVQQVSAVVNLAADIARKLGHVAFLIGHINKGGEASGAVSDQHAVDGTIHGTVLGNGRRKMTMEKHRHGETSKQTRTHVECAMGAAGLADFRLVAQDSD